MQNTTVNFYTRVLILFSTIKKTLKNNILTLN